MRFLLAKCQTSHFGVTYHWIPVFSGAGRLQPLQILHTVTFGTFFKGYGYTLPFAAFLTMDI